MNQNKEQDLYRIGTVASLTGISVERLRAWERRYDLAPAHKAGKTRFYSKPQLHRLQLIKHLTDTGHAISSLAPLSVEQLQSRLEEQQNTPTLYATSAPSVGLVGSNLQILEQQAQRGEHKSRVEVTCRWANMEAFAEEQSGVEAPAVLFLQLPVLNLQAIDLAEKYFPDTKLVAIYQFAAAPQISQFEARRVAALKWPLTWAEIEHLAISEQGLSARDGWAPKKFSDEELIAIAATSEDPSRCPEYLIESITQLNALSTYAAQSGDSVEQPQPYRTAARYISQARAQLESTLEMILGEAEA